ncbi:sperm flagellar protein 2 [Bufo gargarizans]|uniref:sperm flagellar protein 2 n=1 Tax=Bufo gargarizans TaxID=30331 RepID=UPI001CF5BF39|nr:sperm flagellar protein 2 [Bufo gargarizans]
MDQNTAQLQAMINEAVAASMEKAFSRIMTAADGPDNLAEVPQQDYDSEASESQVRADSRPQKRHWKGEKGSANPDRGKAPAKRDKPSPLAPSPEHQYSSDEEDKLSPSMNILDSWQAADSDVPEDAWGSDEGAFSGDQKGTFLDTAQLPDDSAPPLEDEETILDPSSQRLFDPRNIRHPRSGDWTPPDHLAKFMHLWLRKPMDKTVRNRLRSECPRPLLPDFVAQTPEFDQIMTTFMSRGGRDPRKGVEKAFHGVQDKLLDSIGPLSRILYLADDALARSEEFDANMVREWAHDIREWAQRCFCFVGNANVALSSERRKAALLRLDGKLVELGTKELGPLAQGKLFGETFLKELNRHVNVFTSLNKAQTSMKRVFRANSQRGVFGRAGRHRGRAASRFWPSGPSSQRPQPFYPETGYRQPFSFTRGADRGRGSRARGRARFNSTEDYRLIANELLDLHSKGAVEPAHDQGGFFSNLFLVKKKTGDFRPVLNLKKLNSYVRYRHFKMEGIHLLRDLLRDGDWFTRLDLKDAYLSVPVHLTCRRFLRFLWQGFVVNFLKSELSPTQTVQFLGFEIDSRSSTLRLPATKIAAIKKELRRVIRCFSIPLRTLARINRNFVSFLPLLGKTPEKKEEIPSPPPPATPPPPPPPSDTTQDPPATISEKKTSAKKGKGRSKSPKESSVEKTDRKDTPRGKDAAPKSPKSGSARGRSPGKKTKSVPVTPEPSTPPPVGPPPIMPGSAEWVYVHEPLPKEVPEFLVPYWETIEKTYENRAKVGLRSLRQERLIMIHYLYDIRNRFKDYLQRPDHKQEFVSQWQSDFNSIAEDMREDEETKAELHQRVDDLRDCLWDICDNRKEEAEQERADVMSDGWLEDHLGILMNHFFSLMQVEVDRFQDTMRFLHDYYEGMENKIPSENGQEFVRIPLLDISNSSSPEESENPRRIPLVPRRPQTPEMNSGKQKSKGAAVKGKEDPNMEVAGQLSEADQKLIHEAWQTALSAIANMVANEKQALEAEEEKEHQLLELKEKERFKASQTTSQSNQKGVKKKSPNRKKGEKSPGPAAPTPPPAAPEDSSEQHKKQESKVKMRQEYLAALECEEATVNSRLELVKAKALEMCQEIVTRSEQAYKDTDMWLGARFLAEMSSIGKLIQIAHHCIETSTKIQHELVLEQSDFYINSDIKVIPDPAPPPRPPPVESSTGATLTVSQLQRLHKQFLQVAPDGLMSSKLFSDVLMDLTSVAFGDDALPDFWMHRSLSEIQEITSALSDGSDCVNWRKFLLCVSSPWPYPSLPQLLETLQRFKAVAENACGTVHEEQYNQVELWFTVKTEETEPEDPTERPPFNRLKHLIRFFFDLFAESAEPPRLDYTDMLLYFASHPIPMEGFYRALSVTVGRPVMQASDDHLLVKSLPAMDALEEDKERIIENDGDDVTTNPDQSITLQEVLRVFQLGAGDDGDTHRFRQMEKETNNYHKIIKNIFNEMRPNASGGVSLPALLRHPIFHELVEDCQLYKLPDIQDVLEKSKATQSNEGDSATTSSTAS